MSPQLGVDSDVDLTQGFHDNTAPHRNQKSRVLLKPFQGIKIRFKKGHLLFMHL